MNMKLLGTLLLSALLLLGTALFLSGCESVNRGAREAGKPVGGALAVPQSFTEGVNEGYVGEQDQNPYRR
ncbi:MAG: hypothetical protein V2A74_14655 [bacterium]